MKIIKAIYNFIVGDMTILVGVLITLILLIVINNVSLLASLKVAAGAILVIALFITLVATLYREIKG
jgi:hypothetical protein